MLELHSIEKGKEHNGFHIDKYSYMIHDLGNHSWIQWWSSVRNAKCTFTIFLMAKKLYNN